MSYTLSYLLSIVMSVLLVMFSAMVHEVSHGWVAHLCGDDTALEAGRISLDPRAHLDSLGSVVLPILCALIGAPIFAFAKPVPYNPARLRHPKRDEVLVALAGPASNLAQALLGTALLGVVLGLGWNVLSVSVLYALMDLITTYIYVNLVLCFFNLIPFPPLDGSKVVLYFLPNTYRIKYYQLQRYAIFALMLVLYVIPGMLGIDPLGAYLDVTAGGVYDALLDALAAVL